MIDWEIIGDKVKLIYEEGEFMVSKVDFDRAFGAMINSTYEKVRADFAIA